MAKPLPKATPELAKEVWESQRSPSARSVARALTLSGRPVHYVTVNRWRRQGWRAVQAEHPLDRARADLESMLALDSGNPLTSIDDLRGTQPKPDEHLTDAQLLRRAATEAACDLRLGCDVLMRRPEFIVTRMGDAAALIQALAKCLAAVTAGFAQAHDMAIAEGEHVEHKDNPLAALQAWGDEASAALCSWGDKTAR